MTAKTYPMLSSDGHLEVLPERWTGRMSVKYRALAPHTTTLPDGSDAIVMEGAGPFKVNYIDLRGGRKADDWQPVAVKVETTSGIGPPEQRLEEKEERLARREAALDPGKRPRSARSLARPGSGSRRRRGSP